MASGVREAVIREAAKNPDSFVWKSLADLAADPDCDEQILIRCYDAYILSRLRGPSIFNDAS